MALYPFPIVVVVVVVAVVAVVESLVVRFMITLPKTTMLWSITETPKGSGPAVTSLWRTVTW